MGVPAPFKTLRLGPVPEILPGHGLQQVPHSAPFEEAAGSKGMVIQVVLAFLTSGLCNHDPPLDCQVSIIRVEGLLIEDAVNLQGQLAISMQAISVMV